MRCRLRRLIIVGAALIAVSCLAPVRVGVVCGNSMQPALHPGDLFLVRQVAAGQPLHRYELVVVRLGGRVCIKRLIGLEGDSFYSVRVKGDPVTDNRTLVLPNNVRHWEDRYRRELRFHHLTIPSGCVFVVGDSPLSLDCRQLGPIRREEVIGEVVAAPVRGKYRGPETLSSPRLAPISRR